MDIKKIIKKIFEKGNPGLGWFVLWRIGLAMIPLNVISALVAEQAGTNPAAGVGMLFALPIGGNVYLVPVAIPLVLILWNWIGKMALRKKLGVSTGRFVGWALYWRFVLLQLAGILALVLVFLPLWLLTQSGGETAQIIILSLVMLVGLPALIFWNLNVTGFVIRQVASMVTAEASGKAAEAVGSRARIRDYRVLFDVSLYGMNWMIAGAYVAAGLIAMVTFQLVQALFSGEFNFGVANILHVIFISLIIGGIGLAVLLHRIKSAWQVVVLYSLLMAVALILIETTLMNGAGDGFGDEPIFNPAVIFSRLSFAALFCAGLLLGLRFGGPTILGFALGIGAGQLVFALLVDPLIWSIFQDIGLEAFWHPEGFATQFLFVGVDAAVTGAALWWACDWHLGRKGLRLTQQGSIVPRA
jgi:hypothetical protein